MGAIRVVFDTALLHGIDRVVRRLRVTRSALIRDALRKHLSRLSILEKERQDREGYARHPITAAEFQPWDRVASWPSGWKATRPAGTASRLRRERVGPLTGS
jgi:hypothetical protein